jgi:hypothetical protein
MNWSNLRRIWLGPFMVLGPATVLVFFSAFLCDWYWHRPAHLHDLNPIQLLFNYDLETLQNALGNLASTVSAVMGVVITVVAIVVQLAATRYTPRVTELFFKERTNLLVLGFFVVSCITAIWVSLAVGNGFLPRTSVILSIVAVSLSLLLIVPYFAFVFDFLDPERVVSHIQEQAILAARDVKSDAEQSQERVLGAIEQLADIAVAAVSQQDKIISARAVDALRVMIVQYTETKPRQQPSWFEPGRKVCSNPDFLSMNQEALSDLVRDQVWLEWKVLRQYQTIYNEALAGNPDMNYLIAINTRYLGEAILSKGSPQALRLVVKFFNTYMRATLNKRQVRTAYNLMNQYRQLAEAICVAGHDALVVEIAGYLRYYGQTAHSMDLGFVTETISYDVASLCELAHRLSSGAHDRLLGALLELDKEAESAAQETTLRGVRKAQARLAAYYLQKGDERSARRIHRDMEQERPERLASIRDELLSIFSKDFWEVIDRGANFDYMEPARKEHLTRFYEWFPSVPRVGETMAPSTTIPREAESTNTALERPAPQTGERPAQPAGAPPRPLAT